MSANSGRQEAHPDRPADLAGARRRAARRRARRLLAGPAQAEGKVAETRLQIIQIDLDLRTEVNKDLREIEGKVGELMERIAPRTS